MIGLIFYGAIALWLFIALYLGRQIPQWFKLKPAWSWLFVPLVFFAPVADEIIGDLYMTHICNLDGGYSFSTSISSVSKARVEKLPMVRVWHFYSIDRYESIFIDVNTGNEFMREINYENNSGLLLRILGLGSISRTCNKHASMDGKGAGFDGYQTANKLNELLESEENK